jgi:DNA-binding protein H-NS
MTGHLKPVCGNILVSGILLDRGRRKEAVNEKVIDWSAYADEDIARFLEELTEEREKRQAGKRKALKEQINKMLKEQGLSLEDVFPAAGKGRGRAAKGEERQVKYRNPADASQTWTGAGRQPAWLKEALAAGKTLADFAV